MRSSPFCLDGHRDGAGARGFALAKKCLSSFSQIGSGLSPPLMTFLGFTIRFGPSSRDSTRYKP